MAHPLFSFQEIPVAAEVFMVMASEFGFTTGRTGELDAKRRRHSGPGRVDDGFFRTGRTVQVWRIGAFRVRALGGGGSTGFIDFVNGCGLFRRIS